MGLTEHTQSFVFAGKQNAHQVDCSVPQGSILIGLRSFVQYTDDITDTIQQHDVSITMHHIFTPTIRNSVDRRYQHKPRRRPGYTRQQHDGYIAELRRN